MNSIQILNIKVDNINYKQTLNVIEQFIYSRKSHQICTVNPEYIMAAQKDLELAHIINNSNLNLADGGGLLFAAKFTGQKLNYKVTGVDLVLNLANLSNKKGHKIFLLGGVNRVAETTAKILQQKYPNCHICGTFEGKPDIKPISKKIYLSGYQSKKYFDVKKTRGLSKNNTEIIQAVTRKKPDILLVAYGCPKQDKFIARFAKDLNVPVMIGVGGSFDYISGKIKRAPAWMRQIHLEWLYRVICEPQRLNRILTATIRFPWAVLIRTKK